jgi:ATP-dependent Clp protease ATP-binding subunit ClpC
MFEQYDDKARRAIFFARYEASETGSSSINSLHLLLGILRENGTLFTLAVKGVSVNALMEECRRALPIEGEKISTSVDLPLSKECKQALEEAAKEAEAMASRTVQPTHLTLGLIKASQDVATILGKHGVTAESLAGAPARVVEQFARAVAAAAPAILEFVCRGERIASSAVNSMNPIPRADDEVVFTRENQADTYRVLGVRHYFEGLPPGKMQAHCWLVKVVIDTERIGSTAK